MDPRCHLFISFSAITQYKRVELLLHLAMMEDQSRCGGSRIVDCCRVGRSLRNWVQPSKHIRDGNVHLFSPGYLKIQKNLEGY